MESSTTQNHGTLTTFQRKERILLKQDSEMAHVDHHRQLFSNGVHRRRRSTTTHRRQRRKCRNTKVERNSVCDDDDNKAGIEKRIMALQSIVPGGESLGIDKLFEETAGYILALEGQVKAMKVLTSFFEGLEKETSKLGG